MLIVLSIICSSHAFALGTSGTPTEVIVTILNSNNQPVPNASITLKLVRKIPAPGKSSDSNRIEKKKIRESMVKQSSL